MSERKLPRWIRKLNIVYQLILTFLGCANFVLTYLDGSTSLDVPKVYFEICASLLAIIPVVWSKFLDTMKQYQAELTPDNTISVSSQSSHTPPPSPSSVNSV